MRDHVFQVKVSGKSSRQVALIVSNSTEPEPINISPLNLLLLQFLQHPAICEFPSCHFYDGKLKTSDAVSTERKGEVLQKRGQSFWPNPDRGPIMLCHVEGSEKSLTVSGPEGNERSKSNAAEAELAVSITSLYVCRINYVHYIPYT